MNNNRVKIENYFKENSLKKLHAGCGENRLPGWLNTDKEPLFPDIVYLDLGKPFPFYHHSFDYVFSEHAIEHLNFTECVNMLRECFRVLKPGGKIRLATPDLSFLFNLYRENKSDIQKKYIKWATRTFLPNISNFFTEDEYLDVFVINNFFQAWEHKIIHNFKSLELMLKKTGFAEITREKVGLSREPHFANIEHHGNIIPAEFNWLETMVIEAVRSQSTHKT